MDGETETIDEKIKGLVSVLNDLGIHTTGSCEGHIDHGAPAPWIKITPRNQDGSDVLKEATARLLKEFYRQHAPAENAGFIIEDANVGFWIHNGGNDYIEWRSNVKKRSENHRDGIDTRASLTSQEMNHREKVLPAYQREISLLADFLKKKLNEG